MTNRLTADHSVLSPGVRSDGIVERLNVRLDGTTRLLHIDIHEDGSVILAKAIDPEPVA